MKNVLIIGGSSDIGINLGKKMLSLGYRVIATYNNREINDNEIEYVKCDVRIENDIERVIKYSIDKYGKIDILINLASISRDNYYLDKSKNEFMNVLEVNLGGTFLTNKIYSKYIDDGMIINMSSTDGIDTYSMYSMDYSASKAGIINLSKSMSLSTNNKILCICPNWIDSDSTRLMDKEYLDRELVRIGQSRLITLDELSDSMIGIIESSNNTGDVFRIDMRDDKLWIEKV